MEKPTKAPEGPSIEKSKEEALVVPTIKFTIRNKAGVWTYFAPPLKIEKDEALCFPGANYFKYSGDGAFLAVIEGEKIRIFEVEKGTLITTFSAPQKVGAVAFSPKGSYLLTWHRNPNETPTAQNLLVWNSKTGEILGKFLQKQLSSDNWPTIKWSADESVSGRQGTNEIHLYAGSTFSSPAKVLRLQNVSAFEFSPDLKEIKIATFVPEGKGGVPASVKIWKYSSLDNITGKSFFKAQEAKLLWNPQGTHVTIWTHTDMDKTGKSYYGENALFFLSADGKFDCNVPLKKEGPIYDVSWNPNGKQFLVIHGFMPPQSTVFDLKCNPIADFGNAARNFSRWSPSGRLLALAGFGNLQGYLDVWDPKKLKKVGSTMADYSASLDWSPDSNMMLTGVLFPRMRIDNCFKLWSFDGSPIYEELKIEELYEVGFRPSPSFLYKGKGPKVSQLKEAQEKQEKPVVSAAAPPTEKKKYVPPHMQGRTNLPTSIHKEEGPTKYVAPPNRVAAKPDLPPGWTEDSKQKRNKKKKPAKKEGEGIEEPAKASAPEIKETTEDPEKKIKVLKKKLRQIEELKSQQKGGKTLDPLQIEKVKTEGNLKKELVDLEKKLQDK